MGDIKKIFTTSDIAPFMPFIAEGVAPGSGSYVAALQQGMSSGSPQQMLVSAGLAYGLPQLPGDLGKFFGSTAGQALLSMFIQSGGNVNEFGNILEKFGLSGVQKDVVEDVLALTVLAAISKKYSEGARKDLEALQNTQKGTINELLAKAKELYPDEATFEKDVQRNLEGVSREFERARDTISRSAAGIGRGEQIAPQMAITAREEAVERLRAMRESDLGKQQKIATALQAEANIAGMYDPLIKSAQEVYMAEASAIPDLASALYQKYANKNIMQQYGYPQVSAGTPATASEAAAGAANAEAIGSSDIFQQDIYGGIHGDYDTTLTVPGIEPQLDLGLNYTPPTDHDTTLTVPGVGPILQEKPQSPLDPFLNPTKKKPYQNYGATPTLY